MHIQSAVDGETMRHVVVGDLDADNCTELGTAVLATGPHTTTEVSFGGVNFLDSSALSELLRVKTEVEGAGNVFVLADASPQVRRVLEITGLIETFGLS